MTASAARRTGHASRFGRTEARIYTKPLRRLTPRTTHGYSVIEFAAEVLGIQLYPWQKWLLIHALELNPDGTYRFRKIFILVGRQNGKTTLIRVLALWWLFVDADSFPEHLPAREFLVLGTAQNLDTAKDPWRGVVELCDPDPDDPDLAELVIPDLQAETRKIVRVNSQEAIELRNGAEYAVRAAGRKRRGKATARVLMDEMREQQDWSTWSAVSKTANSVFNSQVWGISSAGDAKSVVLKTLRDAAAKTVDDWEAYTAAGIQKLEDFANEHDMLTGLFEWSAAPGKPVDDLAGILQANPSIGYRPGFLEKILSDIRGGEPETETRTEVLCQWVTAAVDVYLDPAGWTECADGPEIDAAGRITRPGSAIDPASRRVASVDTSSDRKMTHIAVAGYRADGLVHGEEIARRAGMIWSIEACKKLREATGINEIAIQTRGCPAAELADPLRAEGFQVIEIAGFHVAASAGSLSDKVRDRTFRHRSQPSLNLGAAGATTKKLGEVRVWDRDASPVDISGIVAVSQAVHALDLEPENASSYADGHGLVIA